MDAAHDADAAARGWSPREIQRLNSYMMPSYEADGHLTEDALHHKLLPAIAPAEASLFQDAQLDALGVASKDTRTAFVADEAAAEGGRKRSSRFREAHVWVKETGRQLYLGGYECEAYAAEAFDIACLKAKGPSKAKLNFGLSRYAELQPYLAHVSMEELVMAVRRQSQGFARGTSSYRGVTRHPNGRWEARLGVPGSRHIYLGLFQIEEEAARAYDRALVRLRGPSSATNFALADYASELQAHEAERAPSEMPAQPILEWPFEELC